MGFNRQSHLQERIANVGSNYSDSTNKLLNFLILTAINRGGFTMLTALLNVILVRTSHDIWIESSDGFVRILIVLHEEKVVFF